jgi:methionyl-tRNA synthetase
MYSHQKPSLLIIFAFLFKVDMSKSRYTVTAALPYANGPLHLGHVAGVYLPADIFVRFLRLNGHDVAFICGTDEHGAAITLRAKKEGITPQEIVDKYNKIIGDAFQNFGISFDIFHRTSAELHHKTAQDFFLELHKKGKFIEETTEQYYDEEYNQFLADRYITGECPKCHNPNAYGDQCEKCGSRFKSYRIDKSTFNLKWKNTHFKINFTLVFTDGQHETWLKEWIKEGQLDGQFNNTMQKLGEIKS